MTEAAQELKAKILDLIRSEINQETDRATKRNQLIKAVSVLTDGKIPTEGFSEDSEIIKEYLSDDLIGNSLKQVITTLETLKPMNPDEIEFFKSVMDLLETEEIKKETVIVEPTPVPETKPEPSATSVVPGQIKGVGYITKVVYLDWFHDVPKYRYFVTDDGKVHELIKMKDCVRKPRLAYDGSIVIDLRKKNRETKTVELNKVIWEAFNPEYRKISYTLGHKDGDTSNCHIDNLYVV